MTVQRLSEDKTHGQLSKNRLGQTTDQRADPRFWQLVSFLMRTALLQQSR
jgi:hypothetical protein